MILITSDFHLGYAQGTEREPDSYFVLDELLRENPAMILFAGDLFDSRVPRLEVFSDAMQFLSKLKAKTGGRVKMIDSDKEINPRAMDGIPFISVYGNHDRRPNLVNPVQALDRAGLLINLHCQKIVFEVDGEKIAVHGMSHVPEKYARDVLEEWAPKPVPGAKNILLMHQNIEPFVYSDLEDVYLKISDLPQGFDYLVNGHIHWHNDVPVGTGKLLMPGSTVATQLNKKESEVRKGYFSLNGELSFKEIKQRPFIYQKVDGTDEVKQVLEGISPSEDELKPIVKLKIKNASSIDLGVIEKSYKERAILVFQRAVKKDLSKKASEIVRKQMTAEELGMSLLKEKSKLTYADELLGLILDDDLEGVEKLLRVGFEKRGEEVEGANPPLETTEEPKEEKIGETEENLEDSGELPETEGLVENTESMPEKPTESKPKEKVNCESLKVSAGVRAGTLEGFL